MSIEKNQGYVALFSHGEPLGPNDQIYINQTNLGDEAAKSLLESDVSPFKDMSSRPYTLLLGRQGSGKTALLTEIRLKLRDTHKNYPLREHLPVKGEPFIINLNSWEGFHQLVLNVSSKYTTNDLLADMIPSEHIANLWYQVIWDRIIQHFYNFTHFREVKDILAPVNNYISADSPYEGSEVSVAKRLFLMARAAVINFLEQRDALVYFLFDSMERYPVRNPQFSKVLAGLFRSLNQINYDSARVQIVFCIPEEVESFMTQSSANLLKDFASSYRIRWTPMELLRITAHRYRISMKIHDPVFFKEIEGLDFSSRNDIHKFFSRVLPKKLSGTYGAPEDPLAYIIRHTQLNPRHILTAFNAILSRNYHATGGFRTIGEDAIRSGVGHVQEIIARHILYPYQRIYPLLIDSCRKIFPDLTTVCSYADLKKVEGRFDRIIEDDIASMWDVLFQMGIIGRVSEDASPAGEVRYCYAQFHFNTNTAFSMPTIGEYCFHPVFSRAFGITRRDATKRLVYPDNLDMISLSE